MQQVGVDGEGRLAALVLGDRDLVLLGEADLVVPSVADGDALSSVLSELDGLALVEVANEAIDSNNPGDALHPSTEALWDAALGQGARVWGVATDDSHHYDDAAAVLARGEEAYVGDRGFVMVRAERSEAAIRAAISVSAGNCCSRQRETVVFPVPTSPVSSTKPPPSCNP